MGFYGNITNTSNTTFSFDRTYPNRLAMDANVNNDGIFIGRYVLVEYQEEAAYPVAYHATETFKDSGQYYFYSSTNQEEISKIKYLGLPPGEPDHLPSVDDVNAIYQDGFYKGEILQRYIYSSDKKDWIFSEEFYECIGEDDKHFAIFKLITAPSMKSHYIQNFEIDEKHYGQESKGFKGYDSTVWMKSSVTASDGKLITKYVNIADLNSVVPTFDIAADAPTMEPLTPHFDADSTNVYYKLHAQAPYGFRIKKQENELFSDEKTKHYTVQYHKDTGVTTSTPIQVGADIYYNKEAFRAKPEKDKDGNIIPVVKKDTATVNEIKLQPSGYSENYDNKYSHKTAGDLDLVGDIQEFSLHLPAIGNMMSDAWDIIHGPNRDDDMREFDADGKNVSSLKGRLDSIDTLEDDTIPVKRDADGKLVGNKLNGGKTSTTDYTGKDDDEWIETLVNGNKETITIHHTYDLENKLNYKDIGHLEGKLNSNNDTTNNIDLNDGTNVFKINTPIVDSMGHVVGRNTEAIELPYGYKYFKTEGLSDVTIDLYSKNVDKIGGHSENKTTNSIDNDTQAHNTQDTLSINPANKWIQTKLEDTSADGDILTIAHEIHSIDERDNEHQNLNTDAPLRIEYPKDTTDEAYELMVDRWQKGMTKRDAISIPDWSYDEAGHIKEKRNRIYTLPYGFKYIDVGNDGKAKVAAPASTTGTQTADSTQDTLKLTTSNKWILLDGNSEDAVQFGHLLKTVPTTTSTQSLSDEVSQVVTFKVYDDSFDEAGHHNGRDTKTITMPFGYGKIKGDNGNTAATATYDELNMVSGDDWINTEVSEDTVTITHTGPVVTAVETKSNIENPSFGSTFTIEDWHFDSKGHMHTLGKTHTVQFPKGNITHPTTYSNNTEIITSLDFNPESGVISYQKDNSGTLKLTANYTNEGIGSGSISGGDSLNTAFAKLEKQVMKEANERATDILKEVSDRNLAISSAISAIVDKDDDGTINKLAEVIDWINNNPSTATQMQTAIQNNTTAIGNEKTRAEGIEAGLQEQINALGTASTKAIEDFATAQQGITANRIATIIDATDIVNYQAEDFVSKEQYDALLEDYNDLKDLVDKLNKQLNPDPESPVEGE